MTADFLSAPLADILPLHAKAAAGDPESIAFFKDLFAPAARCFLCDLPIGAISSVAILRDPTDPAVAVMAPECGQCLSLSPDERCARELRMVRSIWPNRKWTPSRDVNPGYRRGPRAKPNRKAAS